MDLQHYVNLNLKSIIITEAEELQLQSLRSFL